ncbi:MAG: pilus assembly protein [Synechococcus sp. TMED90]|nr:MAG: pilus assembly protein [Synechococcus sp. TMED90]
MRRSRNGFTLVEVMVVVAIVGISCSIGLVHAGADRDRLQLDAAARRLRLGLERARLSARRDQQACAVALMADGWVAADYASLPPCSGAALSLQEGVGQAEIKVHTNLPSVLRVSANGLLLDGGTTVLSHFRVSGSPCLVVSLPLGISRIGRYAGSPLAGGDALRSSQCLPLPQEG